jgi:Flp pilus assembly protein TadB
MNIDDLKDTWKTDNESFKHSSLSEALQRQTTSAIAKVRNNMRVEFISTMLSYLIMLWFLFSKPKAPLFLNLTSITLCVLVILNCFYYIKFYSFYKATGRYDQNIKESMRKIVYDLELNTELYKTYNICITPLTIVVALGIIWDGQASGYIYQLLTTNISIINMLILVVVMLISFITVWFFINLHIKYNYQRYLEELKLVLKQVNDN